MRDTQLAAYNGLTNLKGKRLAVAQAIGSCPGTLVEIAFRLGWPINRVSGRVTELSRAGVVVDSGHRRINPDSGKNGIVWRVNGVIVAVG